MRLKDLLRLCGRNIFSAPLRSGLTVLGIAIGVGAVLTVLTLGDAGKNQVRDEMTALGIDRVWISAEGGGLYRGDGDMLGKGLGIKTSEVAVIMLPVRCGSKEKTLPVLGCDWEYLGRENPRIQQGSLPRGQLWEITENAVALGSEAAKELGAKPGSLIHFGGYSARVMGIVDFDGEPYPVNLREAALMPIRAFGQRAGRQISQIVLSVPESVSPKDSADRSRRIMEKTRGIPAQTLSMQAQIEAADSIVDIFVKVLTWVAGICMLVGGIGVMNILLVSVRERRRETGIMKALGTSPGLICLMFLLEAAGYAAVGAAAGLLMGHALAALAGESIGLSPVVKVGNCALVAAAAMAVGLLFGALPAWKAARMQPAQALRDE